MSNLLIITALLGHMAICIAIVNRFHGVIVSRRVLRMLDAIWYCFAIGMLLAIVYAFSRGLLPLVSRPQTPSTVDSFSWIGWAAAVYIPVAILSAVLAVIHRLLFVLRSAPTERLTSNHTRCVDLVKTLGHRPVGSRWTDALARLPGNEILQLHIHDKKLVIPRLKPALNGLSITHLSDLHLTGQLSKAFYSEVVAQANGLGSDLVVITGDIVEKSKYLAWIPEILGKLRGRYGVYYVLGNHERRIHDEAAIRSTLNGSGMVGLGGRVVTLTVRGCEVLLAGTEMPWYQPAPRIGRPDQNDRTLRILLSHSPDQLPFARQKEFDLMLAGHTHGGQARLFGLGPILSPSINGIRYASGTFFVAPTLLHVSRGIAGTRPLRWNCPPEISKLILVGE